MFAWAADRGEVVVRRIYGNPKNLSDWKKCIDKHGIEPVGNYADGRNAADFAMTIDALDILHDRKDVDGFCIVASDNHFASLARRLCKEECFVAILWSSGPNKPKSSFKDECDAFMRVGNCPGQMILGHRTCHVGMAPSGSPSVCLRRKGVGR